MRCPPGTPHYPGLHNLGSRDWTSDERDPWPALGEYDGSRSWIRGDTVQPYPRAVLVGDAACIEDGEDWPPEESDDYELLNGYDSRCYSLPRVERVPALDITNRQTQALLALIQDFFYTDPTFAVTMLQDLLGPDFVISYVPNSTSNTPGTMIAVSPKQTVVIVSGTSSFQQLALQAIYAQGGARNHGPFATNDFWWNNAFLVHQRIVAAGADPNRPITLIGHSYGGVIATINASRYHEFTPNRPIQLLTYGMPKPGDQRLSDSLLGIQQVHFANDGDPVASLPSSAAEVLPVNLGLPNFLLDQWLVYRHPPGRVTVDTEGRTAAGNQTTTPYPFLFGIVTAAVTGTPVGTTYVAHEIKSYWERLSLTP